MVLYIGLYTHMPQPSLTFLYLHNKLIIPKNGEECIDCSTLTPYFENEEFNTAYVTSIHVLRFNLPEKTYTLQCVDSAGSISAVNKINMRTFEDWLHTSTRYKIQDHYPSRRECIEFFIGILCLAILFGIVIRNA